MLKLVYKVRSCGVAMVCTSARNAGDPWFESGSWYDQFLYVNTHLFILMPVLCNTSNLLKILNSDTGSTFSQLFFICSFLYLQVTVTCMRAWKSSNFGLIGPPTAALAALERLKKSP